MLDWAGTSNQLLDAKGYKQISAFFSILKQIGAAAKARPLICIISGSSAESSAKRLKKLSALAAINNMPDAFAGIVAEYCGFYVTTSNIFTLSSMDDELIRIKPIIQNTINNGKISPDFKTIYNILFDPEMTREEFDRILKDFQFSLSDGFDISPYFNEIGKEIDIKLHSINKASGATMALAKLQNDFSFSEVIFAGDTPKEDLIMLNAVKDIKKYFICTEPKEFEMSEYNGIALIKPSARNLQAVIEGLKIIAYEMATTKR